MLKVPCCSVPESGEANGWNQVVSTFRGTKDEVIVVVVVSFDLVAARFLTFCVCNCICMCKLAELVKLVSSVKLQRWQSWLSFLGQLTKPAELVNLPKLPNLPTLQAYDYICGTFYKSQIFYILGFARKAEPACGAQRSKQEV